MYQCMYDGVVLTVTDTEMSSQAALADGQPPTVRVMGLFPLV